MKITSFFWFQLVELMIRSPHIHLKLSSMMITVEQRLAYESERDYQGYCYKHAPTTITNDQYSNGAKGPWSLQNMGPPKKPKNNKRHIETLCPTAWRVHSKVTKNISKIHTSADASTVQIHCSYGCSRLLLKATGSY